MPTNLQNNPVKIDAGQLSACFEDGMLRSVCIGSIELVRRIYPALRDHNWNTIPYQVTSQSCTQEKGSFSLVSSLSFLQNGINYSVEITVTGTADNTIELRFCGTAHSGFLRNRIGLCLLHPLDLCKNTPCEITHSDGTISHEHFPGDTLAPHQPFIDVCAMSFPCRSAGRCTIQFTGDTFETEDQRNWTDGSFKTYSTPLSLPIPHPVTTGDTVVQCITISFSAHAAAAPLPSSPPHFTGADNHDITIDIRDLAASCRTAMQTGLSAATTDDHSSPAARLIAAARPRHLRIQIDAAHDLTDTVFGNIAMLLKSTECSLECAVFFSENFTDELSEINFKLQKYQIPCCRILVFVKGAPVTPPLLLQAATELFSRSLPQTTVFGGTDNYFVEINRVPVVAAMHNGICFSANPQVHTFDNRAIIENLDGLDECTRFAAALAQNRPAALSPLTMRPRKNPQKPLKAGGADDRQKELFAAAWLTGAIAACVKSGMTSLTCFNALAGSEGIMDDHGQHLFPVYHVCASGIMAATAISAAIYHRTTPACAAIYFTVDNAKKALIANLSHDAQTIIMNNIPAGTTLAILDECTLTAAQKAPGFWQQTKAPFVSEKLSLNAYAVALLSFW